MDEVLDDVAEELNGRLERKESDAKLLFALAGTSLAERLKTKG